MDKQNCFGVMLDNSRNAVMKPEQVKKFVDYIAPMGYNSIQLYTEDTYEVDGEPYFGYLRGRYTKEELKDIDAYCKAKGVELIPCVQTLAHLERIFRWTEEYWPIRDQADVLLVEEERTYTLIENIFATLAECFTSRRVNIGMDEAHFLGRGKYLDKHGYVNRFDIISKHLKKVLEIADKYGFRCMMWSDMFLRLANDDNYYAYNVTDKAIESVPSNVDLIYWDYYHTDKKIYDKMIDAHKKLVDTDRVWFAGGAWTWKGFAPDNGFTQKTMRLAMRSCREKGVENIFITVWGDDGKECSFFSILPSLYYVKQVYDGVTNMQIIKDGFKELTGLDYDAMSSLDIPNNADMYEGNGNLCKYLLYNDPFLGSFDLNVEEGLNEKFASCARKLGRRKEKGGEFGYIFDSLKALCEVLSLKAELGVKLRAAYKAGDKASLAELSKDMKKIEVRLDKFYAAFRKLWFTENKPHGFDVQDIRIGGVMRRMKSCRETVEGFVKGEISEIPELSENLLYAKPSEKKYLCFNSYVMTVSPNVI